MIFFISFDWGDLMMTLGKVWRDLYPMYHPEIIFPFGLFFFSIVRIYILPTCMYYKVFVYIKRPELFVADEMYSRLIDMLFWPGVFQIVIMGFLLVLNTFWTMVILRVGINAILNHSLENDVHYGKIFEELNFSKIRRKTSTDMRTKED